MLTTQLEWHDGKNHPPTTTQPNNPQGRSTSNLCLVRNDEGYGEAMQLAYYVIPAKVGDIKEPCWIDLNGNELFYDVLYWADLTETCEKVDSFCVTLS